MAFRKMMGLLVAVTAPGYVAAAVPSYVATLEKPAASARLVSSERTWTCHGSTCQAGGAATSPAKHICVRLAEEVGAVTAFSAKGRAFSPDELAACNSRAGHGTSPAAAK